MSESLQGEITAVASLFDRGDLLGADVACTNLLRKHMECVPAIHLCGLIKLRRGELSDAVRYLRRVVQLSPEVAEHHNSLGAAYAAEGSHAEAVTRFTAAKKIRPDFTEAFVNLAGALRTVGRWGDAEKAAIEALHLDPGNSRALEERGIIAHQLGRLSECLWCFRKAIKCGADVPTVLKRCAIAFSNAGRVRSARRCLASVVRQRPDDAAAHSDLLFMMRHDASCTLQSLQQEHQKWSRRHAEPFRLRWKAHLNERSPNRRLHVGYISADFRDHSVARFLEPLIEFHDRRHFHITCYSDVVKPDAQTARIQRHVDLWRDTKGLSPGYLAEVVRQDRIDILIDPTGHMGENRMQLFAQKPAPIQVAFPGYPGTSGISAMDGLVTDALQNPSEVAEAEKYSEKLLRLESSARCYRIDGDEPPVGPLPALVNGFVTFGSFQRPNKITYPTIRTWIDLLKSVPTSKLLWSIPTGGEILAQRYRRHFAREGVAPDRLQFVGYQRRPDYLALFHHVDVALDAFPYNGCTTTCDGLYMGVPSVSLTGNTYVSRVGLSILSQVKLELLATSSIGSYVHAATQLSKDLPRLNQLRQTLRQTMQTSPLCDGPGATASFERVLRQLWTEWCTLSRQSG